MTRAHYFDDEEEFQRVVQNAREYQASERGGDEVKVSSEWAALSKGRTVGKRIGFNFISGGGLGSVSQDMLEVRGVDHDALPLSVLLSPPRFLSGSVSGSQSQPNPNVSGTQAVADLTNQAIASPFARIAWGMGGILNSVDVDVHNGALVTLSGASFVRVSGFITDPPETVTDGQYELSAFVGPGRDKGLGGQRTLIESAVAAVGAFGPAQAVPNFARRVQLCGIDTTVAGFVGAIRFFRDFAKSIPVCEYLFAENTVGPFMVPNGAYYFAMSPQSGNVSKMFAVFDLAI